MRNLVLASVRTAGTVLHTVPEGNRHALCGIVAEHTVDIWAVAPLVTAGTRRLCGNCLRVKPARDTRRPVDPRLSEPTDVWEVTNKAGTVITRVYGTTMEKAGEAADALAQVRRVSRVEGGFSLRRLTVGQLRPLTDVDELVESSWSTMSLSAVLTAETGPVDPFRGRLLVCSDLIDLGLTLDRVNTRLRTS